METRTINGETYSLVKKQRSGIDIYRGNGTYLRIGNPDTIRGQMKTHQELERMGVPVARIIQEGVLDDSRYFIEESLGEKRLLELFEDDMRTTGEISDTSFAAFLSIVEKFLRAQIASPERNSDSNEFAEAVHLETVCAELPEHADTIRNRFRFHLAEVQSYPFRFIHGDFNPANMYMRGVIDFEDTSSGPIGYDAVCAIETQGWFPLTGDYEFLGKYSFPEAKKAAYLERCDSIMKDAGLLPLSATYDHFAFFRALWLTARMHHWPKLQKHRYELFIRSHLG